VKGERVMTTNGNSTIESLLKELANYSKELPITMYDQEQGYVSVEFENQMPTPS